MHQRPQDWVDGGVCFFATLHCFYSKSEKPPKCPFWSDQESDRQTIFPRTGCFCGIVCWKRKALPLSPLWSAYNQLMLIYYSEKGISYSYWSVRRGQSEPTVPRAQLTTLFPSFPCFSILLAQRERPYILTGQSLTTTRK